jgi:hypothetical protein
MQTERVTFLTTPKVKAALTARAAARGVSVGEYIRRKVEDEDELTPEQEAELSALVAQVNEAVPKMAASLDRMSRKLRETSEDVRRTLDSLSVRR